MDTTHDRPTAEPLRPESDREPGLDPARARGELREFSEHYRYDTGYLEDLLDATPLGFRAFADAQPLSAHRRELPLDAHFVARIVTMQAEDCGACGQLNVRMALEAGVERETLRMLLERPEELPPLLAEVRAHTRAVLSSAEGALSPEDLARAERLRRDLGAAAFGELALAIVGSRLFPTLKRALGQPLSCEPLRLDG